MSRALVKSRADVRQRKKGQLAAPFSLGCADHLSGVLVPVLDLALGWAPELVPRVFPRSRDSPSLPGETKGLMERRDSNTVLGAGLPGRGPRASTGSLLSCIRGSSRDPSPSVL